MLSEIPIFAEIAILEDVAFILFSGNAKNYYILTRYTINITVKNIETLV